MVEQLLSFMECTNSWVQLPSPLKLDINYTSVIPAPERGKERDQGFKVILGYSAFKSAWITRALAFQQTNKKETQLSIFRANIPNSEVYLSKRKLSTRSSVLVS